MPMWGSLRDSTGRAIRRDPSESLELDAAVHADQLLWAVHGERRADHWLLRGVAAGDESVGGHASSDERIPDADRARERERFRARLAHAGVSLDSMRRFGLTTDRRGDPVQRGFGDRPRSRLSAIEGERGADFVVAPPPFLTRPLSGQPSSSSNPL
jgi:hypothetical protein